MDDSDLKSWHRQNFIQASVTVSELRWTRNLGYDSNLMYCTFPWPPTITVPWPPTIIASNNFFRGPRSIYVPLDAVAIQCRFGGGGVMTQPNNTGASCAAVCCERINQRTTMYFPFRKYRRSACDVWPCSAAMFQHTPTDSEPTSLVGAVSVPEINTNRMYCRWNDTDPCSYDRCLQYNQNDMLL